MRGDGWKGSCLFAILLSAVVFSLCDKPELDTVRLLLPYTGAEPAEGYSAIVAGFNGCFHWQSTNPAVVTVQPVWDKDGRCASECKVKVPLKGEKQQTAKIIAEDVVTRQQVRCTVVVSNIAALTIVHRQDYLNIGDLMEVSLLAKDSEDNSFSTVAGLPFSWTVSGHARMIDYGSQIAHTHGVHGVHSSDKMLVQGIGVGDSNIHVDFGNLEPAALRIRVVEDLWLIPSLPMYAMPHATLQYHVKSITDGVEKTIAMPSDAYRFQSDDVSVATVGATGLVSAISPGSCKISVVGAHGPRESAVVHVRELARVVLRLEAIDSPADQAVCSRASANAPPLLAMIDGVAFVGMSYTVRVVPLDTQDHVLAWGEDLVLDLRVVGDSLVQTSRSAFTFSVNAVSTGHATLHLHVENGLTASLDVSVRAPLSSTLPLPVVLPAIASMSHRQFLYVPVNAADTDVDVVSSDTSVVSVSSIGETAGLALVAVAAGNATVTVFHRRNSVHCWLDIPVTVAPVSKLELSVDHSVANVGTNVKATAVARTATGSTFSSCTAVEIGWLLRPEASVDGPIVLINSSKPISLSDTASSVCSASELMAVREGEAALLASLLQNPSIVSQEVPISVASRLTLIRPLSPAVLSLGASVVLVVSGGVSPAHPPTVVASAGGVDVSPAQFFNGNHVARATCLALGDYHVEFVHPTGGTSVSVPIWCSVPTACLLSVVPTASEYAHTRRESPAFREQTLKVPATTAGEPTAITLMAVFHDAQNRTFLNASSLLVDWKISNSSVARLAPTDGSRSAPFVSDFTHVHTIRLLSDLEGARETGAAENTSPSAATVDIVVDVPAYRHSVLAGAYLSAEKESAMLLGSNHAPFLTAVAHIVVVRNLRFSESSLHLLWAPHARATVSLVGAVASAVYQVVVSTDAVNVTCGWERRIPSLGRRECLVSALSPGSAVVTVSDTSLSGKNAQPAVLRVTVAPVARVELDGPQHLPVKAVALLRTVAYDSDGNVLHPSQLMLLDSSYSVGADGVLQLLSSSDADRAHGATHRIDGTHVGSGTVSLVVRRPAGAASLRASLAVDVFPPFACTPPQLRLLPGDGGLHAIRCTGGPRGSTRLLFTSADASVVAVHPSSGLLKALAIGTAVVSVRLESSVGTVWGTVAVPVRVAHLSGVRLRCPAYLRTTAQVAAFVEGVDNESPALLQAAGVSVQWSLASAASSSASLRLVHRTLLSPLSSLDDTTQLSVLLYGVGVGHTTLTVSVRVNSTHKFHDRCDVHVIDDLRVSLPATHGPAEEQLAAPTLLVLPPGAVGRVRTSKDGLSSLRYTPDNLCVEMLVDAAGKADGSFRTDAGQECSAVVTVEEVGAVGTAVVSSPVVLQVLVRHPAFLWLKPVAPWSSTVLPVDSSLVYLQAMVCDATGLPFGADAYRHFRFEQHSSNYDVAELVPSGASATIAVRALSSGRAVVDIAVVGSGVVDHLPLSVGLGVWPPAPVLHVGGDAVFVSNLGASGHWESSDPSLVSIDAFTGLATAQTAGAAVVTFTSNGQRAQARVRVTQLASLVVDASHVNTLTNAALDRQAPYRVPMLAKSGQGQMFTNYYASSTAREAVATQGQARVEQQLVFGCWTPAAQWVSVQAVLCPETGVWECMLRPAPSPPPTSDAPSTVVVHFEVRDRWASVHASTSHSFPFFASTTNIPPAFSSFLSPPSSPVTPASSPSGSSWLSTLLLVFLLIAATVFIMASGTPRVRTTAPRNALSSPYAAAKDAKGPASAASLAQQFAEQRGAASPSASPVGRISAGPRSTVRPPPSSVSFATSDHVPSRSAAGGDSASSTFSVAPTWGTPGNGLGAAGGGGACDFGPPTTSLHSLHGSGPAGGSSGGGGGGGAANQFTTPEFRRYHRPATSSR